MFNHCITANILRPQLNALHTEAAYSMCTSVNSQHEVNSLKGRGERIYGYGNKIYIYMPKGGFNMGELDGVLLCDGSLRRTIVRTVVRPSWPTIVYDADT